MSVRGTSAAQDGRYFAQEKKLLAKMTFPACFDQRVDMDKVQRDVINQWVTERITQLLGFEDDIVVAMAINLLEPKVDEKLDPKQLQVALTGFLEKQAGAFTEELWQLLLSAQSNPTGIPSAILDKKKQEIQKIAQEKSQLKKVLDAKKTEAQKQSSRGEKRDRDGHKHEKETISKDERRSPLRQRRRSRSLQRRPRGRSRSARRHRRSPSPRRRRRSRSSLRGRSRRRRSRSPSVKRRRSRRSPSRSPERMRGRRSERSSKRERSRRSRASPSSSSSESSHRSSSSSRSPSPARRRSTKSRRYSDSE